MGQYSEPYLAPNGPVCRSRFLHDNIMNPHQRFSTLTANIRERRGSNVAINMPLFKDTHTPPRPREHPDALDDHIYMDAMGFGMGCACLQVRLRACVFAFACVRVFACAIVRV